MVRVRLNLPNPFTMGLNWECDLTRCPNPRRPGSGWRVITLNEWHQRDDNTFHQIVVENLPDEHEFALNDMGR